jgi:hypothetical protein
VHRHCVCCGGAMATSESAFSRERNGTGSGGEHAHQLVIGREIRSLAPGPGPRTATRRPRSSTGALVQASASLALATRARPWLLSFCVWFMVPDCALTPALLFVLCPRACEQGKWGEVSGSRIVL